MSRSDTKLQHDRPIKQDANNKPAMLRRILTGNTYSFQFSSCVLRDDADYMLAVLKQSPKFYPDASYRLRHNSEFLNKLIMVQPIVIKTVGHKYLNKNACYSCLVSDPRLWKHLPKAFRYDSSFLDVVLTFNELLYFVLPLNLQKDEYLFNKCVEKIFRSPQNAPLFKKFPQEFQNDESIVLKVLSCDGSVFRYIPDKFKSDWNVLLHALKHGFFGGEGMWNLIPIEYQNTPEVTKAVLERENYHLIPKYIPCFWETPEMIIPTIRRGMSIREVLKNCKIDVIKAVLFGCIDIIDHSIDEVMKFIEAKEMTFPEEFWIKFYANWPEKRILFQYKKSIAHLSKDFFVKNKISMTMADYPENLRLDPEIQLLTLPYRECFILKEPNGDLALYFETANYKNLCKSLSWMDKNIKFRLDHIETLEKTSIYVLKLSNLFQILSTAKAIHDFDITDIPKEYLLDESIQKVFKKRAYCVDETLKLNLIKFYENYDILVDELYSTLPWRNQRSNMIVKVIKENKKILLDQCGPRFFKSGFENVEFNLEICQKYISGTSSDLCEYLWKKFPIEKIWDVLNMDTNYFSEWNRTSFTENFEGGIVGKMMQKFEQDGIVPIRNIYAYAKKNPIPIYLSYFVFIGDKVAIAGLILDLSYSNREFLWNHMTRFYPMLKADPVIRKGISLIQDENLLVLHLKKGFDVNFGFE